MRKMARRYDSREAKRRILSACVKLFVEQGYKETTMNDILSAADVSCGTFQNIFKTKSGVLFELVRFMFEEQFSQAAEIAERKSRILSMRRKRRFRLRLLNAAKTLGRYTPLPITPRGRPNISISRRQQSSLSFFPPIFRRFPKAISMSLKSERRESCAAI